MNNTFFQFILAFSLTWLLIAAIFPLLKKRLLDQPNSRSSHKSPTPRGGGLAFVIVGTIIQMLLMSGVQAWVPVACLPLAVIGFLDDYYDLPARYRYFVQVLTAFILLLLANLTLPVWLLPVAIVAITAFINFMNFMDGMDGLLAGCCFILMLGISNWIFSGAIFAFLLWNWSPAKLFMGDVGSTYLGALFVGFALQENSIPGFISIMLLAFPLYTDALTCLIRRLISGKNIFSAHRQHLYQRLHQAGWKHSQVSTLYILAVLLLLIAKSVDSWNFLISTIIGEVIIGLYLDFNMARRFEDS
jgi:Fuc2NAc and GlcNAc transferase